MMQMNNGASGDLLSMLQQMMGNRGGGGMAKPARLMPMSMDEARPAMAPYTGPEVQDEVRPAMAQYSGPPVQDEARPADGGFGPGAIQGVGDMMNRAPMAKPAMQGWGGMQGQSNGMQGLLQALMGNQGGTQSMGGMRGQGMLGGMRRPQRTMSLAQLGGMTAPTQNLANY